MTRWLWLWAEGQSREPWGLRGTWEASVAQQCWPRVGWAEIPWAKGRGPSGSQPGVDGWLPGCCTRVWPVGWVSGVPATRPGASGRAVASALLAFAQPRGHPPAGATQDPAVWDRAWWPRRGGLRRGCGGRGQGGGLWGLLTALMLPPRRPPPPPQTLTGSRRPSGGPRSVLGSRTHPWAPPAVGLWGRVPRGQGGGPCTRPWGCGRRVGLGPEAGGQRRGDWAANEGGMCWPRGEAVSQRECPPGGLGLGVWGAAQLAGGSGQGGPGGPTVCLGGRAVATGVASFLEGKGQGVERPGVKPSPGAHLAPRPASGQSTPVLTQATSRTRFRDGLVHTPRGDRGGGAFAIRSLKSLLRGVTGPSCVRGCRSLPTRRSAVLAPGRSIGLRLRA